MQKLISSGLIIAVSLALAAPAIAQTSKADPAAGARKVSQCAGCHGIPGWRNAYPAYSVPKLGGQHADYIAAALKSYQAKVRAHPGMQGIAASLSDQDIADIAAFLAANQ